jgi:hypothetical protein
MLGHTHGTIKEYLLNLGERLHPITKAVSEDLIAEMLGVRGDKIRLKRLWQKDWWQNCIATIQKRDGWRMGKRLPSVCSMNTGSGNRRTTSNDTGETLERPQNESDGSEHTKMELDADLEGSPHGSPLRASLEEKMEEYLRDRYILGRWLQDERDFKSYMVIEYDPFQGAARELHEQLLKNAVDSYFGIFERAI